MPITISTKECARILGVSTRLIKRLTHDGVIRSSKIGGRRRIHTRPLIERYGIDADDVLRALNEE